MTGILDGLVKRGWVERVVVDDDRRGVTLEITPDGRRALDVADAAANAGLEAVLATVSPAEREIAADGLAVLSRALATHLARDRTKDRTKDEIGDGTLVPSPSPGVVR